jgi:hypothetical protein
MKFIPKFKTRLEAKQEALKLIIEGKSTIQNRLYTRYPYLNIALGKGFPFKRIVLIAGPSGHGKSKLLNDLISDFNNKELNGNFGISKTNHEPVDIITIHFCFEMLPADEILRETSSELDISFSKLLGVEWEDGKYTSVDPITLESIQQKYSYNDNPNYYYFEDSCTVRELYPCIEAVLLDYRSRNGLDEEYKDENGKLKRFKIAVALDHTLLLNGEKNQNDINIMQDLAKFSIQLKKKGFLVILVGQFNGNIEDPKRISNPASHFPLKSDIYAQAQIYNACDIVGTIYCPELLGILSYTLKRYNTIDLINFSLLKNRGAKIGQLWFKNELYKGNMESVYQDHIPKLN